MDPLLESAENNTHLPTPYDICTGPLTDRTVNCNIPIVLIHQFSGNLL